MVKKKSRKHSPAFSTSIQDLDNPPLSAMAKLFQNRPVPPPRKRRRNIVKEFNRYFGEQTKLENWQRLCRDVGVRDDLTSITQCRLELKKVWVNIYDLLDAVNANTTPHIFQSLAELRAYTMRENRVFPKKEAKKGGPVKSLLAHLFVRGDR